VTPRCDRCDTELPSGYRTHRLTAVEQEMRSAPDGATMVAVLAAVSACSWSCLSVLAAQRAMGESYPDGAVAMVAERERQLHGEGWAPEHDDQHRPGELAAAGVCYAMPHAAGIPEDPRATPEVWPWDAEWWKPKDVRADLVRAGALLAAELDRDRRGRF
jgi:hypothetical protein